MSGISARAFLLPALLAVSAACADPFIESTILLSSTPDAIGPYELQSIVIGTQEGDKVEIFYNAFDRDPDHYIPLVMEPADADGRSGELFIGAIPHHEPGDLIRYFVAVTRDEDRVAEDPVGGDLRPYQMQILP